MNIKLYTQKGCPQCEGMKRMLEKKNIDYEVILVTEDNVEDMKKIGVMHTPTLEIDGQKYVAKPAFDMIKGM